MPKKTIQMCTYLVFFNSGHSEQFKTNVFLPVELKLSIFRHLVTSYMTSYVT